MSRRNSLPSVRNDSNRQSPPQNLGPIPSSPHIRSCSPPPGRELLEVPCVPSSGQHESIAGPSRPVAGLDRRSSAPLSSNVHRAPSYNPSDLPDSHRPSNQEASSVSQYAPTHPALQAQSAPTMTPGLNDDHFPPRGNNSSPLHAAYPASDPSRHPYYCDARPQRRKPVRASQPCGSCRQRKSRCDEGRPECQMCKENGVKCTYPEVPTQKAEQQVLAITKRLQNLNDNVSHLMYTQRAQDEKMQKLLDMQTLSQSLLSAGRGRSTGNAYVVPEQYGSEDSQPYRSEHNFDESLSSERRDYRGSTALSKSDTPPKHNTAVHDLLEWPSIQTLVPRHQSNTYVMDVEASRKLLRLPDHRGDRDPGDGQEQTSSPVVGPSSEGCQSEDITNRLSTIGASGNPSTLDRSLSLQSHAARQHSGSLSQYKTLPLDSLAVDRYFQAFMENIHILHPFLDPIVLQNMISTFKKRYSWHTTNTQPNAGTKRKRETTVLSVSLDESVAPHHLSGAQADRHSPDISVEHSVANAIVLLVLALGTVCDHKEPIPAPHDNALVRSSDLRQSYYTEPQFRRPFTTPNSPIITQTSAVPSPAGLSGKHRDGIPGLAYFAKAADILSELPGGVDISYVQANLLAGLFMGQLARIFVCHHYISLASRGCQILIESSQYNRREKDITKMSKSRRKLINLAFWSCLQLENEILTEVNLPSSGIARYEERQYRELPTALILDNMLESESYTNALVFYLYQVQLWRIMNDIHSSLNMTKEYSQTKRPSSAVLDILDENLEDWRDRLGSTNWDDNNYKSPDIHVARMRATYYSARYHIHRPSIHYLLRDIPKTRTESTLASNMQYGSSSSTQTRIPGQSATLRGDTQSRIEHSLISSARKCVEAAIKSTTVYDAIRPRLIVTNIFGTAHAQFGNMLVLSATYASAHPEISSLISGLTLRRLFDRTFMILQDHKQISPVLASDAVILQHVRQNVFPDG